MANQTPATCSLCGHPMPEGEQMFKFHGYSGPCPQPPIKIAPEDAWTRIGKDPQLVRARQKLSAHEIRLIIKHTLEAERAKAETP